MSRDGMGGREGAGALGAVASSGGFAVTAEMPTVDTADPAAIASLVAPLSGVVDAVSCTDNSGAHAHTSSVAVAKVLLDHGFEPIAQFACRDRNRLALQSDLLGASALGVRNVCIMTGDDVTAGDHPDAKRVFDLDSTQLIRIASELRDGERYLSGRALTGPPSYTIGAVENPFAPPMEFRPARLAKKIEAGAEFVFTQIAFDLDMLGAFMAAVVDMGLHERAVILVSVFVLGSARAARFIRDQVPGNSVPDEVVRRLEAVPGDRQRDEGVRVACDVIRAVREMPGVRGVHLMGMGGADLLMRAATDSGLLDGRRSQVQEVT